MNTRTAAIETISASSRPVRTSIVVGCAIVLILTATWGLTVPARAADTEASWQPVDLPDLTEYATLKPSDRDADGIPVDATFTLTSIGDVPAADLAGGLHVEPDIELRIEDGPDPMTVTVRPDAPLAEGQRYRFELRNADGSQAGSWVFRARAPLQVIGTLPADRNDWARPDSGIEITFDHAGLIAPRRHFSIEPRVRGRIEVRGDTLSFVPARPLATGVRYTVTLTPGLRVEGSEARLEEPFTFSFQTRPSREQQRMPVRFRPEIAESAPGRAPVIGVYLERPNRNQPDVTIHRFRNLDDVADAVRSLQYSADWGTPPRLDMSTDGLRPMGTMTGRLQRAHSWDPSRQALTLQRPLPRGWYLLTIEDPAGDGQAILQVTDLAVYAHISRTDSLFWVNSIADGRPVADAEIRIVGGPTLGTTDDDGLLVTPTLDGLTATDPPPLVEVRSNEAAILLPFAVGSPWESPNVERGHQWTDPGDRFWNHVSLDRQAYRPTDTINIWGLVRLRDDGSVPAEVELRLVSLDDDSHEPEARPVLASTTAIPAATGVFSTSFDYEGLPLGDYLVEAVIEGERFGQEWLSIESIIKPAYRLAVDTDRRAFMSGEDIDVEVAASFFEGTAVPAAPLSVTSRGTRRAVTTDAAGTARTSVPAARVRGNEQQIGFQLVQARPANAEQGEITAGSAVAVVNSSLYLDADARLRRGRVRLDGSVHQLDLDRLDRQMSAESPSESAFWRGGDFLDPRGRPAGGQRVTATVTEHVPVRRKTGTVYDFIAKKAIPTYEWDSKRRPAGVFELQADAEGRFSLQVEGQPRSDFSIDLQATDGKGRTARQRVYADVDYRESAGAQPYIAFADAGNLYTGDRRWSVGDELSVELRQGRAKQPSGGDARYLFLVQHRGLREHAIVQEPVFDLEFSDEYVPTIEVGAVGFTGDGYIAVPDSFAIAFDAHDRSLDVEVTPEREHYAPGDSVQLSVQTTDPDGQPEPASVVLHAIDEKLYAMGLVGDANPLEDIYRSVGSGLVRSYASHQLPGTSIDQGGGGDTAGGGSERADFRDVLLFRQVETDADGRATVTFDTSDDLTSWRIAAAGVTDAIDVGTDTSLVSVGLPFFVEVVSADDYLVADEAHISIRAYGAALAADDPIAFSVSAPSLGMDENELTGVAFRSIDVPLPPLSEGRHEITVTAEALVDGVAVQDAIIRPVSVVPSRLVQRRAEHVPLVGGVPVPGGGSLTSVLVGDEGRGRFYPELMELAWSDGPRADQALAAAQARRSLERWFPGTAEQLRAASFDARQFQRSDGSIALLPFGSSDEAISFLVALASPDAVDGPRLARWFGEIAERRKTTRDRALRAVVAQAALGQDVLADLQAIAAEQPLSAEDSLVYAIGLASAGDRDGAFAIERELLAEYGQQLGDQVRLRLPDVDGAGQAPRRVREARDTALLSILAAQLGDDGTALAADAYVRQNPTDETVTTLQHIAVIDRLIERAAAEPAQFSLQLDGDRHTVALEPGDAHHMTLTAAQREAIDLQPEDGTLGVTSAWAEPLDASAPGQSAAIEVRRSVRPRGPIATDGIAEVTIEVDLGEDAASGCYLVTDMAPSGLAPVRRTAGWPRRRDRDAEPARIVGPMSIEGQRVDFCVGVDKKRPKQTLRYLGRVVTPGSYVWEPTLVQSIEAPDVWRLGAASVLELGGASGGPLGTVETAASDAGQVPGTRRQHENALLSRLAVYDCQRWRQDDQPFEFGAIAAVQCDQPEVGISQLALFTFPDAARLGEFWDWRVEQVDLGGGVSEASCADGRPALMTSDGAEAICYVSGAGAGQAKIRWIDEASRLYGVLDATDGDITALYAWWSAQRG